MELRQIRYFVAVAETLHFGRAAEHLQMTQPPLSRAIKQLEGELGTELLVRSTRRVDLTAAGASFLNDCRRILGLLDTSVRVTRQIGAGERGTLRIAFSGTAAYRYLPRTVRALRTSLPFVELDISADVYSSTQRADLEAGVLDLGVLRQPVDDAVLESRIVARERLLLVAPVGHPTLAEPGPVSLEDLRDQPFIFYASPDSVVNASVVDGCSSLGFSPFVAHRVSGTSVMLSYVAANLGVAVVPESVESLAADGIEFRPLVECGTIDLLFAWRVGSTSALLDQALRILEDEDLFHP